nr:hypothetical protein [uncultured Kingella sp.]
MDNNSWLCSTGPATITSPENLIHLKENRGNSTENEFITIIKKEGEHLMVWGDLNDFSMYLIVEHPKFFIIKNSISLIDSEKFKATIVYFANNNKIQKELIFQIPYEYQENNKIVKIETKNYSDLSINPEISDGIKLTYEDGGSFCFFFNFEFINQFLLTNPELFKIHLLIKYIGISFNRDALERLCDHSTRNRIESNNNNHLNKSISVILYRYKEGELNIVNNFQQTLEGIEATLVQYFKPEENTEWLNFPNSKSKLADELRKKFKKIIVCVSEPRLGYYYTQYRSIKKNRTLNAYGNQVVSALGIQDENINHIINLTL